MEVDLRGCDADCEENQIARWIKIELQSLVLILSSHDEVNAKMLLLF